jgi:hypothetical protein
MMQFRSTKFALVALVALSIYCPVANAGLVAYQIDYTVEYFGQGPIDPDVTIGKKYFGFFALNDAILATDGLNKPGEVFGFYTRFEDVIWSSNFPYPVSQFVGFRGPGGLGAPSPGFDVYGGQIVNLRGGVFGHADVPFIDFSTNFGPGAPPFTGNPTDGCTGSYCGNDANHFWTLSSYSDGVFGPGAGAFGGLMTIHRVAEPEIYALMLAGLGLLGWVGRRKKLRKRVIA